MTYWRHISNQAKDLVSLMLEKSQDKRITIEEVLEHEWIK